VYGIEFSDVLTRGSQFRVESMMFRLAVPENYVMISPSRQQVCHIIVMLGGRDECA
jgi:DNA polymerase zeta